MLRTREATTLNIAFYFTFVNLNESDFYLFFVDPFFLDDDRPVEEHGQLKTLNSCIVDTFRAVPETEFDLQTDMLKTYIQNSARM